MLNRSTKHTETRFRVVIEGQTKMGHKLFIQMTSVQRGPGVNCDLTFCSESTIYCSDNCLFSENTS